MSCEQCESKELHIAIVGSGSAAFAAAIKATEEGAKVTLIERDNEIGGACVNVGCVPSKIFIHAASLANLQADHGVAGLPHHSPAVDRTAMVAQQQQWVEKLRHLKYENILEDNPAITLIHGKARFRDQSTLAVTPLEAQNRSEEILLQPDRILLATGASPMIPTIPGLSDTPYWSSTEALVAKKIPHHLIVLGGSVIALELAQAFRHLGAEVTVVARSRLLSRHPAEIGEKLRQIFEEEGVDVVLERAVEQVTHDGEQFHLATTYGALVGDQLLIATGRVPNVEALQLDRAGITIDSRGAIQVNERLQTSIDHIYAAGDCTNQPQFVYIAAAAGTRAAINMTGGDATFDYSLMPTVLFTHPQLATVGLTVQEAEQQGLTVESRRLDLDQVPRALANLDTRGFIQLVAEAESGRIVGCQVIADGAGDVIQSALLAIRNQMTVQQLAEQLFPYLTMVEGLKLCAQIFDKDLSQLSCCAG